MKTKIIPFIFLLMVPLALATTVNTNKPTYSPGETVQITGTCSAPNVPVAFQLGIGLNTIWVEQARANQQNQFSAAYTSVNQGSHTLYAACEGETSQSVQFCVGDAVVCPPTIAGAAACTAADWTHSDGVCQPSNTLTRTWTKINVACSGGVTHPATESVACTYAVAAGPGPGGGGGRRICVSNWSCGYWTVCGVDLTQTRICYDLKCGLLPRTENRSCYPCVESWICSLWSDCVNNQQSRKCYDQHACGTAAKKPVEQKACEAPTSGPLPAQTVQVPPSQLAVPPPKPPVPAIPEPTFWDKFGVWLIVILVLLALGGAGTFLYFKFFKGKAAAGGETNIHELKAWVEEVKSKGTPPEKIKEMAAKGGWTEEEVNKAL